MKKIPKHIGEILVEKGLITEAQLHDALQEQKSSDGFLGNILVEKSLISKTDLSDALAEQFGIPLLDLKQEDIDMELVRRFSSSLILDHKCMPLRQDQDSVTVAIVNPLDAIAISRIEQEARPRSVNLVMVYEKDIKWAIEKYREYVSGSIRRMLKKDN
jgi:hypothetical protein